MALGELGKAGSAAQTGPRAQPAPAVLAAGGRSCAQACIRRRRRSWYAGIRACGVVWERSGGHTQERTQTQTQTQTHNTHAPPTHTQLRKHTLTIPIQPRPGAAWAGPGGGQRRTPAHPPVTTRAESPPDRRPVANCSRPHRPNASAAPGCSHPRAAGRAAVSLRRRRLTGVGGRGRKPAPAAAAAGTG